MSRRLRCRRCRAPLTADGVCELCEMQDPLPLPMPADAAGDTGTDQEDRRGAAPGNR